MSPRLNLNVHGLQRQLLNPNRRQQWTVVREPLPQILHRELQRILADGRVVHNELVHRVHAPWRAAVLQREIHVVERLGE